MKCGHDDVKERKCSLCIWNLAIENAAKVAENCDHAHDCEGPMIAKAIRTLKERKL
jgi:hypothetical protein